MDTNKLVSSGEDEDIEHPMYIDYPDLLDSEPEYIEEESEEEVEEEEEQEQEDESEEEDYEISDTEFDVKTKLPVLTAALSERLLHNASKQTGSSIRKLVSVFSSVVSTMASSPMASDSRRKGRRGRKANNVKMKFKHLKTENRDLLKATAHKLTAIKKRPKRKYLIRDRDVYVTFVSGCFDTMSEFLKERDVLGKKEMVVPVAPVVRRFFSASIVQLAFTFDDFDLTRSALISLSSEHVTRWICVFKRLNTQFVKVIATLMCGHPQKLTRVNAYQFLEQFLNCAKDPILMSVQLSPRSYSVFYTQLSTDQQREASNECINTLIKRVYSSQLRWVIRGITLKNFGLFKLSQNCIVELYLQTPHDNLYVHAFKTIRDLGFNVRREWNNPKSGQSTTSVVEKKHKSRELDKNNVFLTVCSWGFIESVNIWVATLSKSNVKMKTLVYPLVTVINSAIKIKIANRRELPFVIHLLTSLNQLSDGVNKFIPIGSLVFFLLENLRHFRQPKIGKTTLDKNEDMMVKLKISSKNLGSNHTSKVLFNHLQLVLVDHLGLVSLNPSFPEFSIPVIHYLKKFVNTPWMTSDTRLTLNVLLKTIKETNSVVKSLRKHRHFGDLGDLKVFDPDKIPLFKYRQQLLSKHQQLTKDKLTSIQEATKLT